MLTVASRDVGLRSCARGTLANSPCDNSENRRKVAITARPASGRPFKVAFPFDQRILLLKFKSYSNIALLRIFRKFILSRSFTNSWPNTKNAEFYKLFGQRVVELTDARSPDSYRVHALSTTMKLRELSMVSNLVLERQIPKVSLDPILAEVAEALQNDLVAKSILSDLSLDVAILLPSRNETTEEIQSKAQLALSLLEERYQAKCEDLIVANCQVGGGKKDLLVASKLYLSYLCGIGFHRRFIFEKSMDAFYRSDLGRCSKHVLYRFFKHFDISKKKKYQVVLCSTDRYANFLQEMFGIQIFEDPVSLKKELGIDVPANFGQGTKKRIVAMFDIDASDSFSVIARMERLFELARSFLFLYPSGLQDELDDQCLVFEKRKKNTGKTISRKKVLSVLKGRSPTAGSPRNLTKGFRDFTFAEGRGGRSPNGQLFRALSSAALAGDSNNPETQLITLWSAFEALLPPPTKDEKSLARIVHFTDLVIPALTSD